MITGLGLFTLRTPSTAESASKPTETLMTVLGVFNLGWAAGCSLLLVGI